MHWLNDLRQDLLYALRTLRRAPGFLAITVITLGLGVGANSAIFSVINAVFLRPLPFRDADRICVIDRIGNRVGGSRISVPLFLAWEKNGAAFERLGVVGWRDDTSLLLSGQPKRLQAAKASTGLFPIFGVTPVLGRNFSEDEGRLNGEKAVIIGYRLWRSTFEADPGVIGKTINLDEEAHTIVGVLPPDFELPIPGVREANVWFPYQVPLSSQDPTNGPMLAFGLLKSGVSGDRAAETLTPSLEELRKQFPSVFVKGERARVTPLRRFLWKWAGPAPVILMCAVVMVLLVACTNIAILNLARATKRHAEFALRAALGGNQNRIARQLLAENILLALIAGAAGVLTCFLVFHSLIQQLSLARDLPQVGNFQMDWAVLIFALFISVAAGAIFGAVPLFRLWRIDLSRSLRESGRDADASSNNRVRELLAGAQIGISVVLLVAAMLSLKSLWALTKAPLGFETADIMTVEFALRGNRYDTAQKRVAFFENGLRTLSSLPGVKEVGVVNVLPLAGGADRLVSIEGHEDWDFSSRPPVAEYRVISPRYFKVLGITLVRGRMLSGTDVASGFGGALINDAMARKYWPNQDPTGQHIWIGKSMAARYMEPGPREIVGIVTDAREIAITEPAPPAMYVLYSNHSSMATGHFVIKTEAGASVTESSIRSALFDTGDMGLVGKVSTIDADVKDSLADFTLRARLLTAFGAVGFLMAIIGVYGVMSYWVAQRTRELGVRIALGASPLRIVKLVVGKGLTVALIGCAVGVTCSLLLGRFANAMLYGVTSADLTTYIAVPSTIMLVVVLASYLPAARALRTDPIMALGSR